MDFIRCKCTENDAGRTLEKIIRKILPDVPLNKIYQSIRKGLIKINGKKSKQNDKVMSGDEIWIADIFSVKSVSEQQNFIDYNIKLENIFENDHIRIINKPSSFAVHGSHSSKPDLYQIIVQDYQKKNISTLSFTPGPLHRLDTFTSGLLVFSNSIKGAREFSLALKNNQIKKTYLAVLEGTLTQFLELNDSIEKNQNKCSAFHTMKVQKQKSREAKLAVTKVKPLYHVFDGIEKTFAEIQIETGRTHQIRVQCSNAGFPLAGDKAYGAKSKDKIMLHSYKMTFPFENTIGLPGEITAPLREDFLEWTKKFLPNSILLNYNIFNETLK